MPQHDLIPIAYRAPFAVGHSAYRDVRPHGESIMEMVRSVPNLPTGFVDRGGIVCVNGEPVPRQLWARVRPKPPSDYLPVSVTLHWPLQSPGGGGGGGGSSTKSIVGLVAAIALIAVTAVLTAGGSLAILGALGVTGAALTIGAPLLTAAVGIAGALAISALTAPPTQNPTGQLSTDTNTDNRDPAGAGGNVIAPGGSVPRVIGTRKVFPPFICEPLVQLVNTEDEVVEAVMALNGPHELGDFKIDGVTLSDEPPGIEIQTSNGIVGSSAITLVQRQGRTTPLQVQMSQHRLQSDDRTLLNNSYSTDLPIWHRIKTFDSPDSVWIHLLFPGGVTNATGSSPLSIPFRIRMREVGTSTWINFPEVHFAQAAGRPLKRQIRILFSSAPGTGVGTFQTAGRDWWYANFSPPNQTVSPTSSTTGTTWTAHSYFSGGPGANIYAQSLNEGSTKLNNMTLTTDSAVFYMSSSGGFPKGTYEIELIRGFGFLQVNFQGTTYLHNSSLGIQVRDFFGVTDNGGALWVAEDQTGLVSTCALVRIVSVWNEHPVSAAAQDKFALIAIKATNRQLNRISCIASGLVGLWNGSNWTTIYDNSSNPAAHYRDVLLGAQNHDPLDLTLVDDTGLAAWYTTCESMDWGCDAIVDDMRTQDVLNLLASCGYARPYQSDQYGVIVDDDRSLDAPIQVFSRINSANMHYEKAFARVPSGLIIGYHNFDKDYDTDQEIVDQTDPTVGVTGLYETISYDGLISQEAVAARGKFDLDQANLRSTFYTLDTDIESLVCRRGDLVAIQHDVITARAGDAHIKTVLTSGGNITGLILDAQISANGSTGIAIRSSAGAITTHAITEASDTDTVTFSTPFAISADIVGFDSTNNEYGCLVVSGDLGSEYKRMLVHTITPTKDLKATVALVDEAQALVRLNE